MIFNRVQDIIHIHKKEWRLAAKVTFVYPDFESLGVECLMTVCGEDGHEVDFVFYHAEDGYLRKKNNNVPFHKI